MTTKTPLFVLAAGLLLASAIVWLADPVYAEQTDVRTMRDHLKCYQFRDSNPEEVERVYLRNMFGGEKCKLVVRAKFFCTATDKYIDNELLGDLHRADAGDFLCYNVQCEELNRFPTPDRIIGVTDQFGERRGQVRRAEMLCAPAKKIWPADVKPHISTTDPVHE